MALGVARGQGQLAHQILDVVHDEGEAAVELVEALRIGQRLLRPRLGEVARHLAAGDAQQVEILPVERAVDRRAGQQDRTLQPVEMDQAAPAPRHSASSVIHSGTLASSAGSAVSPRTDVELDDPAGAGEIGGERLVAAGGGQVVARPVPVGADAQAASLGHRAAGRRGVGQVGDRLDDPLVERRGAFAGLARACR